MSQTTTEEMPFLQHLAELRTRIFKSLLGILIMSICAFSQAEQIFKILTAPIHKAFSKVELIGTGPTEAFVVKLKVSIATGILLSLPVTFYQIWCFVAPGLHRHEKKLAIPFVVLSTVFFLMGTVFCYYVLFPFAFTFFSEEFVSIAVVPAIRIGEYLQFIIWLMLIFGLVFELPIVSYFLTRLGLLSHQWLWKNFRYAILVIFITAAVLTPGPDIISQLCLALPLMIIYALSIAIAYYGKPSKPL